MVKAIKHRFVATAGERPTIKSVSIKRTQEERDAIKVARSKRNKGQKFKTVLKGAF